MRFFIFVVCCCFVFAANAQKPTSSPSPIKAAQTLSESASTLYTQKQYEKAAKEFERANAIYPDPSFLFNAAMSYYKCETYNADQQALALFQQFLKLYPTSPKEQLDNAKKKIGEIVVRDATVLEPVSKPTTNPVSVPTTMTASSPATSPSKNVSGPLPPSPRFCSEKKTLCWAAAGTAASFAALGSVYWVHAGIPRTKGGTTEVK